MSSGRGHQKEESRGRKKIQKHLLLAMCLMTIIYQKDMYKDPWEKWISKFVSCQHCDKS